MFKTLRCVFNIFLTLFFIVIFSAQANAETAVPPAPTLIAPNQTTVTAKVKPLIIGLTKKDTLVKIFIDDVYNGKTEILNHPSGTANFAYRPFLNLSPGQHKVYAIAEDSSGNASLVSAVLNFKIELPMPAPTLFKPVVNNNTSLNRPFVVGLAKNDSKIKIYIDKKYDGEFLVKNHPSGTANFAYKPLVALARGNHLVYAVALDKRGKESIWSNIIYFSTKNSAIAESADEARQEAVAEIKEPEEPAKVKPTTIISDSSGAVVKESGTKPAGQQVTGDKDQAAIEKVKSLIGGNEQVGDSDPGMVNEGQQNQGRLKLSLVIFILFLVGVVAWLLWVNRELVKERRAQNQTPEKTETPNQDKLL
jgi:hypothetical protein